MLWATAASDPTKMRAIGHQLGLFRWSDWWNWCGRNGCRRGRFGGLEFAGAQDHLLELHRQIFDAGLGVRVRIADLGDQFPPNRLETVSIPVANQKAIDDAYVEELKALEAGADPMTAALRARQIAEHQKLPAIIELAENLIVEGNGVVLFVNFRDSLARVIKAMPRAFAQIHGDQSPEQRQKEIELFQSDKARLIVCMIQAGGVGLNLHDVCGCPRVALVCPGWSAVELRQALGRIHRAGASPAEEKMLFAEGTIEERIRRKVEKKLERIDLLNDGDLSAAENTEQKARHESTRQTGSDLRQERNDGPDDAAFSGAPLAREAATATGHQAPSPNERGGVMKNATIQRPTTSQSVLPQVSNRDPRGDVGLPALHADRSHSKISPSRLKSLEICPSYADDPHARVHPDTAEGTLCHEALDTGDDSHLTTDEQRAWVMMCREYTGELERDHYPHPLREQRLEVTEGIWGFADLIMLSADEKSGALIDYKFGANSQEDAETNPAAQAYALGMFKRWPTLESVDVHYLYPRRDEINRAEYHRSQMPKLELRVSTIIARANGQPERFAHPDVCQWCGNKPTCPALHKEMLPIALRYAQAKGLALPPIPDFSLVKDPQTWSRLMGLAPVFEAVADSIKRHAIEFRQQSGTEIPGYEMRQRTGRKTVNNALIAWEVAKQEGLTQQEFLSAVDISAKRLADAAGEKAPRGQKAKKIAEFKGKLRDTGCLEIGADAFYLARSK